VNPTVAKVEDAAAVCAASLRFLNNVDHLVALVIGAIINSISLLSRFPLIGFSLKLTLRNWGRLMLFAVTRWHSPPSPHSKDGSKDERSLG
jgi:hypothetical protein